MKCNHHCIECGKLETGNWMDKCAKELNERELCFDCNHWYSLFLRKNDNNVVRYKKCHYIIGNQKVPGKFNGFCGDWFDIIFIDGRKERTCDLWYQGTIPELWQNRLPDNVVVLNRN